VIRVCCLDDFPGPGRGERGEVSRALIAVAEEQDADLVIVGGEPVERTSGGFSGSVADRVSHRAPCSVLIVRRG